jgi:glycosyltransferase involved in cell wall biosynthesis
MPRIALVHDWLDRPMGGGERVLLEMAALFPDAPVHTLLHDKALYANRLDSARVRTSWLQRLPERLRRRPRYLLPLIPNAVEAWDFSDYDIVISSSTAFVKNILTPPRTLHVCYCHAPMRFAWDYWPRYLDEMAVGAVRRFAIAHLVSRMRMWDLAGVPRVDAWLANSETTAARLRKFYRLGDLTVLHPPVAVAELSPASRRGDHYVTLSTLTEYKRIDLAVRAFTAARRPLVVIGDGPDRDRLERLAGPTIRFAGHTDDRQRAELLATARALVFPNEEDFGIAAVEALACGTPVIAYARGGVTEIVTAGRTGVFFDEQTEAALNAAVEELDAVVIDVDTLVAAAQRFAAPRFGEGLRRFVDLAQAAHEAARAPRRDISEPESARRRTRLR